MLHKLKVVSFRKDVFASYVYIKIGKEESRGDVLLKTGAPILKNKNMTKF